MGLDYGHYYDNPQTIRGNPMDLWFWIGVVGSTKFTNPNGMLIASTRVSQYINRFKKEEPYGIVSGGAIGVDTIGEINADVLDYEKCIFLPRNPRWEPEGYKFRNELIGNLCDTMIAVRCADSKTFGSGWTAKYTESLNKPIEKWVIHNNPRCVGCMVFSSWKVECDR